MPRSQSPVLLPGDPTLALHAATKQYVDAGLGAKVNSSLVGAVSGIAQLGAGGQVPTGQIPDLSPTYATLATSQTITGTKTFSSSPVVPATGAPGHAINRGEVDDRGLPDYRASRWGLAAWTVHPMVCNTSGVYSANYAALSRLIIPAGIAINTICMQLGAVTAGSVGSGLNGFAVYEISGATATLVANTSNDVTMWQTAGWVKRNLPSSVAAQGSDREVLIGHAASVATTGPSVVLQNMRNAAVFNTRVDTGASVAMTHYISAPSVWPSTFNTTTNLDYFYPFIGVY